MFPVVYYGLLINILLLSCLQVTGSESLTEIITRPTNEGVLGCGRFLTNHSVDDLRQLGIRGRITFAAHGKITTNPFLALLGAGPSKPTGKIQYFCVGSLISDRWVLTAAHCGLHRIKQQVEASMSESQFGFRPERGTVDAIFIVSPVDVVRLGELSTDNSDDLPLEYPVDFKVVQMVRHPNYIEGLNYNDLLLVQLSSPVSPLRYDIRPICLPWGDEQLRGFAPFQLHQEGWGTDSERNSVKATPSKAPMVTITSKECMDKYGSGRFKQIFPNGAHSSDFVCARGTVLDSLTVEACSHLSGSPLSYKDHSGRVTLLGFVTIGITSRCMTENLPTIFMPAFSGDNLKWIKKIVFNEGPGIPGGSAQPQPQPDLDSASTFKPSVSGTEVGGEAPAQYDVTVANRRDPVSSPGYGSYGCGLSQVVNEFKDIREIYRLNKTAEELEKQGYIITPLDVTLDRLDRFEWRNATDSGVFIRGYQQPIPGSAKLPANRVFTLYMGLIGQRRKPTSQNPDGVPSMFCGGVLLNRDWVLSAAHCFTTNQFPEEEYFVRLGDYQRDNERDLAYELPIDMEVEKIVPHPLYRNPISYHDMALIKLKHRVPYFRYDIRPACLPWGHEIFKDHTGDKITATGWGGIPGGQSIMLSSVLNEVNITVFPIDRCDEIYSSFSSIIRVLPAGVTDILMCAGDPFFRERGDTCQGDSGSPAVYLNSENKYTVLGLVSLGIGCTGKYPGIYTPVNEHGHLQWIKETAFKDYEVPHIQGESNIVKQPSKVIEGCGVPQLIHEIVDYRDAYSVNETANRLAAQGFQIIPLEVTLDRLDKFEYRNATFSDTYYKGKVNPAPFTGKIPARRVASLYMVLLLEKKAETFEPFCGGALISRDWVLTAGHCFNTRYPDVVRLGEYNFADSVDLPQENPIDMVVQELIIFPNYRPPISYHDLALIRLKEPVPHFRFDIRPVCLPWGDESRTTHVGTDVTLTGWGSKYYSGPTTPILQEVNLTVFPTEFCEGSYSETLDFGERFPDGLSQETSLCAGGEKGNRDACGGDSGGPIVYRNKENRYTIAGIVSVGYGCGKQRFPTIFIPLNNPLYLDWIKTVAF